MARNTSGWQLQLEDCSSQILHTYPSTPRCGRRKLLHSRSHRFIHRACFALRLNEFCSPEAPINRRARALKRHNPLLSSPCVCKKTTTHTQAGSVWLMKRNFSLSSSSASFLICSDCRSGGTPHTWRTNYPRQDWDELPEYLCPSLYLSMHAPPPLLPHQPTFCTFNPFFFLSFLSYLLSFFLFQTAFLTFFSPSPSVSSSASCSLIMPTGPLQPAWQG